MTHSLLARPPRTASPFAATPVTGPLATGLVAGQRALSPLAGLALARGMRRHPLLGAGAFALAAGEFVADTSPDAPDRTLPGGLAARFASAAFVAGAFAKPGSKALAGAIAGLAAVASAEAGVRLRKAAAARFGRIPAAIGEDVAVLAATAAIMLPRR